MSHRLRHTILVLNFLSLPSFGAEAETTNGTPASGTEVALSTSFYVSEGAEFSYAPSRSAGLSLSARTQKFGFLNLGLRQGLAYWNTPYEELRTTDTTLSLAVSDWYKDRILPENSSLGLTTSIKGNIGHSKVSTDRRLKGTLTAAAGVNYSPYKDLTLGIATGMTYYFFDETLDEGGQANTRYSKFLALNSSYSYGNYGVSLGFSWIRQKPFEGWQDRYSFGSSAGVSYTLASGYRLGADIDSSDDQIRKGRNQNFRPFDPEISTYTISVGKNLTSIKL